MLHLMMTISRQEISTAGDFAAGDFAAGDFVVAPDFAAGDFATGDFAAGSFLAPDSVAVGDFAAGDFVAGGFSAGDFAAGGCVGPDSVAVRDTDVVDEDRKYRLIPLFTFFNAGEEELIEGQHRIQSQSSSFIPIPHLITTCPQQLSIRGDWWQLIQGGSTRCIGEGI